MYEYNWILHEQSLLVSRIFKHISLTCGLTVTCSCKDKGFHGGLNVNILHTPVQVLHNSFFWHILQNMTLH